MGNPPLKSSRHREMIYLAIVFLPMVLVIIALGIGVVQELACSAEVNKIVKELRNAGEPTDFQSWQLEERRKFPASDVVKRVQESMVKDHLERRYGNLFDSLESPSWSLDDEAKMRLKKEVIARYSDDARPIDAPFQNPSQNGDYDGTRATMEYILATAVQTGDREQAKEILMQIGLSQTSQKWFASQELWTAEDLSQLRELVSAERNSIQKWRNQLRSQRAQFLALHQLDQRIPNLHYGRNLFETFGLAPSLMLSHLKFLEDASQVPNIGTISGMESLQAVTKGTRKTSLLSIPFTIDLAHMHRGTRLWNEAKSIWRSEMTKRHVTTAIAIKQFKFQEGRWPNSLDELTKVGLTSADWKIVGDQDFGYEIQPDGSKVILWTGGFETLEGIKWYDKAFRTPAQAPNQVFPPNISENLQIVIR